MIKQITGLFLGILLFSISSTQVIAHDQLTTDFSDVCLTDWYGIHVHALSDLELVRGYSDSTFQPGANISRAEFIVIAMKLQQYQFPTAESGHWAMHYIKEAERLEIICGGETEPGTLNEPITRAEAARILVMVADVNKSDDAHTITDEAIKDFNAISQDYQPYVLRAFANGWISGFPDGEFKPRNHITRAQAAVMLVKSMGEEGEASVQKMREAKEKLLLTQQEEAESRRQEVLETAFALLGTPYRFGGSTPAGFDCSGFVNYVLSNQGINVPRSSAAIYQAVDKISFGELEPGDLVFFQTYRTGPSHVGFYTGNGEFIHAPSTGRTVSFDRIDDPSYWGPRQIGAARVL